MKQHHTECNAAINLTTDVNNQPNTPVPDIVNLEERERAISPIRLDPPAKRHKPVMFRMDNFVMQTSGTEKAPSISKLHVLFVLLTRPSPLLNTPNF